MMLTPGGPSAVPTGGAGVALAAGNIMDFCKQFNAKTNKEPEGMIIPSGSLLVLALNCLQKSMMLPAAKATPAPPVGTALGPPGVNIMDLSNHLNTKTNKEEAQRRSVPK